MNSVLQITFIVILSVEFIIGIFGNGFIAVVNIKDLVKGRKISSVDQILTALAISRIALLWLILLSMLFPFANTMFGFIHFAVSLVTFVLLVFSLWKHQRKMQHIARGCRDASTKAHIRALQTLIASILLYSIFFLSHVMKVWSTLLLERTLLLLVTQVARTAFPSVHSWVLILGNAKMRKASLYVFLWLRCRHKE